MEIKLILNGDGIPHRWEYEGFVFNESKCDSINPIDTESLKSLQELNEAEIKLITIKKELDNGELEEKMDKFLEDLAVLEEQKEILLKEQHEYNTKIISEIHSRKSTLSHQDYKKASKEGKEKIQARYEVTWTNQDLMKTQEKIDELLMSNKYVFLATQYNSPEGKIQIEGKIKQVKKKIVKTVESDKKYQKLKKEVEARNWNVSIIDQSSFAE